MACTTDFIDFILEVLSPLGEVRSRKMMGDYVIYLNDKCVITACDNNAYIKKLPCIAELMADAEVGYAYEGAKEGYILSFDDQQRARRVISTIWEELPFPKSKKKKS
ncbi:MAG: TfoX/Sxy family protein [Muribaculaceae bacterium]|nr:TfoX/Sxy family protein [Muribaculaceae bacterium]